MNHDATHCMDYGPGCTMACYWARLTKELKEICYVLPVSWAHLKGTKECLGWPEIKEGRKNAGN